MTEFARDFVLAAEFIAPTDVMPISMILNLPRITYADVKNYIGKLYPNLEKSGLWKLSGLDNYSENAIFDYSCTSDCPMSLEIFPEMKDYSFVKFFSGASIKSTNDPFLSLLSLKPENRGIMALAVNANENIEKHKNEASDGLVFPLTSRYILSYLSDTSLVGKTADIMADYLAAKKAYGKR